MGQRELSSHQRGVIQRYYENLDTILLTRLQEMVTDLYLAESEAKKKQLWGRVEKAMVGLKLPPEVIGDILERRSAEHLARCITEWLRKK